MAFKDPEAARRYMAEWGKSRPSRKAYHKAWREANPEKMLAAVKSWQKRHKDRVSEILRAWQKANPDKVAANTNKRRAKLRGSWTATEWQTLKRQYGFRCVGCWRTGRKLVPDHIVPISKGGLNIIENIQPLCHGIEGCNNKKHAKTIDFVIS